MLSTIRYLLYISLMDLKLGVCSKLKVGIRMFPVFVWMNFSVPAGASTIWAVAPDRFPVFLVCSFCLPPSLYFFRFCTQLLRWGEGRERLLKTSAAGSTSRQLLAAATAATQNSTHLANKHCSICTNPGYTFRAKHITRSKSQWSVCADNEREHKRKRTMLLPQAANLHF